MSNQNGILMLADAFKLFKFIRFIALDTIALFRTILRFHNSTANEILFETLLQWILLPVCDDRISRVRNKVHAPIAVACSLLLRLICGVLVTRLYANRIQNAHNQNIPSDGARIWCAI